MKKKVLCILMAATLISIPCFAQGSNEQNSKSSKKTLTMLDFFVPGEGNTTSFKAVLDDFEAANPDIIIEEETISNSDVKTKVQTLAVADELPDIFCLKGQMTKSFVENEKVLDLTKFLNENKEWKDSFKTGVFSNFTIKDKIYGIPFQVTNTCIYYNDKIMKDAGINEFPTTWEDLIKVCKILRAKGITPIVLGNKAKWNAESVIMSTLGNRVSGDAWYKSIRYNTGAKFTDPEFVNALQALSDLAKVGAFNTDVNSIDNAQQLQVFMNGQAAMTIDGTWAIPSLDANTPQNVLKNIKVAALPSVKDGKGNPKAISGGAGWAFAISSKIAPEKKEAALNFIKSIVNKKFATLQSAAGGLTANLPGDFSLEPSQIIAVRFNEFEKERPYLPVYDHQLSSGVIGVMQSGLQNILIGETSAEKLAAAIQFEYEKGN